MKNRKLRVTNKSTIFAQQPTGDQNHLRQVARTMRQAASSLNILGSQKLKKKENERILQRQQVVSNRKKHGNSHVTAALSPFLESVSEPSGDVSNVSNISTFQNPEVKLFLPVVDAHLKIYENLTNVQRSKPTRKHHMGVVENSFNFVG